jgi:hypothetical protein
MIRRRGQTHDTSESSSDEEDAFSALAKRNAAKRSKTTGSSVSDSTSVKFAKETEMNVDDVKNAKAEVDETALHSANMNCNSSSVLPQSVTSSMKRHHKPSNTRKAKMDALLEELEAEKKRFNPGSKSSDIPRFVPEKKGSFVDPGEEHLTTNIFVGGLAPSITEEDLSGLFSQFGEKRVLII